MIESGNVKIQDKGEEVALVTMTRPKYDKNFQLQTTSEAMDLWLALGAFYGFSKSGGAA